MLLGGVNLVKGNKKVVLEMIVNGKIYELSFPRIEDLDRVTVQFKNNQELVKFLFGDNNYQIDGCSIKYSYKTPGKLSVVTKKLPIKYQEDNYDEFDLRSVLISYLQLHPQEVRKNKWNLIYVIKNSRNKTYIDGDISLAEIQNAIYTIWKKGYKTKRDLYFLLKELNVDVAIIPIEGFNNPSYKLKNIKSTNNPYIEYLQSYSQLGEDEHAFVVEQLSMFDLEELTSMNSNNFQLYDGSRLLENEICLEQVLARLGNLSSTNRKKIQEEIAQFKKELNQVNSGKKRCKK